MLPTVINALFSKDGNCNVRRQSPYSMSGNQYLRYFQSAQARSEGEKAQQLACARLVIPFQEISIKDVELVGTKNASLGEMYNTLSREGVRVPGGFAITTEAYRYFLYHNGLPHKISRALNGVSPSNLSQISKASRKIRQWIVSGDVPERLEAQISAAYRLLESRYGSALNVAVRGSATLGYSPVSSPSGQQDSYLNVQGEDAVLDTFRLVFASLFSERAIIQRLNSGLDSLAVKISVGVQKMVNAVDASSGVMTTLDPETGFNDVVFITSSRGLGDHRFSAEQEPDEFYVHKQALDEGRHAIIKQTLGGSSWRQVMSGNPDCGHGESEGLHSRRMFSLSNDEIQELARFGVIIEQHYSQLAGKPRPMEIEWAKDGVSGDLYIVQARPETVHSHRNQDRLVCYQLDEPGWIITSGRSIGNKIVHGKVRVIHQATQMSRLQEGEILVTRYTDQSWDAVLHRASAIITETGGRSSHAARIARERGIPAIVGAASATTLVKNGAQVTLSCRDRDDGFVYEGSLAFSTQALKYSDLGEVESHVDLSIANPNHAFDYCGLPVNGVGLVKLEYIILHNIGVHPRALLQIEQTDSVLQQEISRVSQAYGGRREYYVQRLAEGIAMVAAAFAPRPITVRFSDFKSDEFAALKGGELFEDHDANPLIGFRGAARFLSDEFRESFELECAAIRRVREDMGFENTHLLIPYVRTAEESQEVLALMRENGLVRGDTGLRVLLMCETPANVLLAEDFLDDYDGFMVGMDDLAQLTVGFDAGSRKLNRYDQSDRAILKLISMAIHQCRRKNKFVGVCGLSRDVEENFLQWLVQQGLDSISLEPDAYVASIETIRKTEMGLQQQLRRLSQLRA